MVGRPLVLLLLFPLFVAAARAQTPPGPTGERSEVDRVLDAWEAKAKALTSFTCRFKQEKKVSFMRRPLQSTGTLAFRDRKLLWKTETPSPGFLAVDATEVRIYTPEFKTLEIYPLAGGSSTLSGAFPGFSGDLAKLRDPYVAELLPAPADAPAPKIRRVRLTPRSEELKKEVTAVEIALDEQFQVTAWKIVRANGDELTLTLSDFVANAKVADADLTFEVPADAKVVRPLGPGGKSGS